MRTTLRCLALAALCGAALPAQFYEPEFELPWLGFDVNVYPKGIEIWDAVASFRQKYPRIEVMIDESTRYVDIVAERFDVAIRSGVLTDSNLVARPLAESTLGVYATVREIRSEGVVEGPVLAASLLCSAVLAGFGAAAVARPGPYSRRRLFVLLTPLAAGLAGAAVTFASTRYRAPGEVGLVVLGAVGIVLVADRWRSREAKRPAPRRAAPG